MDINVVKQIAESYGFDVLKAQEGTQEGKGGMFVVNDDSSEQMVDVKDIMNTNIEDKD